MSNSNFLRTKPILPHFGHDTENHKPGKIKRPLGNPVSYPKPYLRFIPPPFTNLVNLSLDLDLILPEESKAALDTDSLASHALGDTGGIHGDDVEKAISDAMDHQISAAQGKKPVPAFYYNLGDVVYFNG